VSNKSHNPYKLLPFKSSSTWSQSLALPSDKGARYLSFMYQWERSQWADPDAARRRMFGQLDFLLHAAFKHTPHYTRTLGKIGYDPSRNLDEDIWAKVPLLLRRDIQTNAKDLTPEITPRNQQPARKVNSSGSTGTPIEILNPPIRGMLWSAATLHEHVLHNRGFDKKAAAIRVMKKTALGDQGSTMETWGTPFTEVFETGPATLFDIHQDPELQADWLIRENPSYLLLFPSSLEALLPILKDRRADLPALEHFRTISEQLPAALREEVFNQTGRRIVDIYSAQEIGYIAFQCPEHDHYHLQQDLCFTEILRDDGTPCKPGEIGRVVVTDPYNFVFPLIRYDIGDFAEMGEPCPCGRTQPVINRIMGRVRNLITLPDGSRHWPMTASKKFREIAGINQFQLVQTSLESIEAKFVCDHCLTQEERSLLIGTIQDRLTYSFDVTISQVDEIARGANGKFEEFKSNVTPEMVTTRESTEPV